MIFGASPILPPVDASRNSQRKILNYWCQWQSEIRTRGVEVRINVRLQDFGGVQQGCQADRANWEGGTLYRPRQYKRVQPIVCQGYLHRPAKARRWC